MFEEDDDEEKTPNNWSTTVEETGPAIDKILDHRLKEGIGMFLVPLLGRSTLTL